MNETRTYADGTTATGPSPLPAQSPAQQDSETGPCDKCGGGGKLFDRRIGDVVCDECRGHGWFNEGVAGPAERAPHEWPCAVNRGGKCTCFVMDGAPPKRPACFVCGTSFAEHGSYPTCATHPYTPDGNCQYVVGARCVGAECRGGCVRASA